VAIDRIATLRNAEKLLRQGKLDQAIAEYGRVVADDPRDWNTSNLIGDLYVRAGKIDQAVEQFLQIANGLSEEGYLPKAGALYKKIVKLKPDHEHALLQAAEIVGGQGLYADARTYLTTVLELRRGRGDVRGVAQTRIRIGGLDPSDVDARLDAARARLEIRDTHGALSDFKEIASELVEKGRPADAIEALREAAGIDEEDPEIREKLLDIYFDAGDYERALQCAASVPQFKTIAAKLEEIGQPDAALGALRQAAALDPEDNELRAHLARTFIARGDTASAAEYLTVETAGDNPQLLMTVAEIRLRSGETDEGLAIARKLLAEDPNRRQDLAALSWSVGEQAPDAGFALAEIAADQAIGTADWASAAAVLQEFVTRVPNHIPALMRLVEICVDGGLEATMFSAQAHLADAYIAAGAAAEARFIAEDLVAREPWERSNVERFRRALELAGEPDPDGIIAGRLSGESPFMSTDLSLGSDDLPPYKPPPDPDSIESVLAESSLLDVPGEPTIEFEDAPKPVPPVKTGAESKHFQLSAHTIDLGSILGDLDAPPPTARGNAESVEVDLSIVLDDIKKPAKAAPPTDPQDLDSVFAGLREDAARKSPPDGAEGEYRRGVELHAAGKVDDAIPALEAASRAPRLRFATAALLGRIYSDRNQIPRAIEWYERAAEAPAPSPDEGQKLLYDLAACLEVSGEVARALAIFMELQAEAGSYRDVTARVSRLTKAQARG
jgi:tetratricopeptide (TPR) repeat protein